MKIIVKSVDNKTSCVTFDKSCELVAKVFDADLLLIVCEMVRKN